MAIKPCRFCMRVRQLFTKCIGNTRKRAVPTKLRLGVRKGNTQKGYIQGDSLLTVIIIIALVVALYYALGR